MFKNLRKCGEVKRGFYKKAKTVKSWKRWHGGLHWLRTEVCGIGTLVIERRKATTSTTTNIMQLTFVTSDRAALKG